MSKHDITVLVAAVGGNVSQGILKALAKAQLRCRVVGTDISASQAGLYTVDTAYIGPWAHEAGFLEWLTATCQTEHVDAILSGNEHVLRTLAAHKAQIEAETKAVCLVSDARVLEIGDDKLLTCQWLEEHAFRTPRHAAAEDNDALDTLARECGYPLIANPRIGGGAIGLLKVADEEDLAYVHRKTGYLVQEYLGDDDSEYTVGCFVDRHGAVRGSIAMRRTLLSGTTYRALLGDFPEVRKEAERISTALRPMGPCNVQLRMTERGPICFEINPRFSGTAPLRAHYGFNEAEAALRHYVLGEDVPELPRVTEGIALRYWNEIYPAAEAHRLLERHSHLANPHEYPVTLEDYGMQR